MLHELLLALLGYTGDLIIDEREFRQTVGFSPEDSMPNQCTFKVAPDISFIQPSERDIIENIITLGFYYRELDRFATKSRNLSWIKSGNESSVSRASEILKETRDNQSVYRRAIANGVVEILSVYRSAVLHIEQKLLSDSLPILATVTQGLNKFLVFLPPLYELIIEIERDGIHGGKLLNLLYKRCHCGVPEQQACVQRLLWHGHQVMYNQLACWMLYGILHDQYGEFFISRQQEGKSENEMTHIDNIQKMAQMSVSDGSLNDWYMGFNISLDMLPEYIPVQVAESILFAGKAIRVLRNPSSAFRSVDVLSHQATGPQTLKESLRNEPSSNTKLTGDELLPQSEADKIESMLKNLQESSEFHKRLFEEAIGSIRSIAANHLWQLVVVRADLNGHLKAIKDYFLLAKGDFFQSFLEGSRQLMRLPPRQSTAEADLMVPFQMAITKTISDEDKYFSRVSLRLPAFRVNIRSSQVDVREPTTFANGGPSAISDTSSEMSLDAWDGIALEYSVDWPLQLFFTQEVLTRYTRIFQYLLRLKRTQVELEKSWEYVMYQDHSDFAKRRSDPKDGKTSQQRRQRFRPMLRVREQMAFLIRNLQFYIQVDVIESQWNRLLARIKESRDFTDLVGFHQAYLSALISQSFLDIGSVSRILDGIMKLCLQFCWKIESQETDVSIEELERITEEFSSKSNSLYTILRSSRLSGSQRAPFLRQFLLRLNFNSYYEANAQGGMNVIKPQPTVPAFLRLQL
ncbi:gamma-tubulin complex component 4-like isoform X1 [Cynara cardunculus var. scolymus]|uniref:gamma-tubulin complex component 4-like isoform X1 n=1 Tax=Cynara cardunculus var. scolymus TaxID=59895 RepID=UPI000D62D375|nr:gamma-tubulin complex component 4-like isoform X1 [Cynara cardunculus var. scolymus]